MIAILRLIFGVSVRRRHRTGGPAPGGDLPRPVFGRRAAPPSLARDDHAGPLPPMPPSGVLTGKCYVIDGDTIVIGNTKIRLAGVDAPELDQPWGRQSKWTMVEICKGHIVTARLTGERSYDRLVGVCTLPDGHDIGAELIARGLALDWECYSGGKYRHLEPPGVRAKLMWAKTKSIEDRVR